MKYKSLKTLYHISEDDALTAYNRRFNSEDTLHLSLDISGQPAFCFINSEIYQLIIQIERVDKEIQQLIYALPDKALEDYASRCLIGEVILTNEIEGISSTRKEIGSVLEYLKTAHDKNASSSSSSRKPKRFQGIVAKYKMLQDGKQISFNTCSDIRALYDELVLEEIRAQNPKNIPDGKYFRECGVEIYNSAQQVVHRGLEPEENIIKALEVSFELLSNNKIEALIRISLFHFFFGYIHPFYDGNGRMNRFMSSYLLCQEFCPLVGLNLSSTIKNNLSKYYGSFKLCEHILNKGDLTPFVIQFLEFILETMTETRSSLADKKTELYYANKHAQDLVKASISSKREMKTDLDLIDTLIQSTLFSENGASAKSIAKTLDVSIPTLHNRLNFLKTEELLIEHRMGRNIYYLIDINKLLRS